METGKRPLQAGPGAPGIADAEGPGGTIVAAGLAEGAEALARRAQALLAAGAAPESILMVGMDAAALGALRAGRRAAGGPRPRSVSALGLALELIEAARASEHDAAEALPASRQARLALLAQAAMGAEARHSSSARGRRLRMLAQALERIDELSPGQRAAIPCGDASAGSQPAAASCALTAEQVRMVKLHDEALRRCAALSARDALWRAAELLEASERLRGLLAARYCSLLIAGTREVRPADEALLGALSRAPVEITMALPPPVASRMRGAREKVAPDAAAAVRGGALAPASGLPAARRCTPAFLLCADRHARARWIAAEVEAQLARADHLQVAVVMPSLADEGRELAGALKARHLPFFAPFAPEMFAPAAVRDLLAWLRLLLDPQAGAGMRLLLHEPSLPPAEVAQISRLVQARRLDLASAAQAVAQTPECSPVARERIQSFLDRYRALSQELAEAAPWTLLPSLIWRAGLHERADPEVERLRACTRSALAAVEALAQELAELRAAADAPAIAQDILAIADSGLPLLAAEALELCGSETFSPQDCAGVPLLLGAEDAWPHPLDVVIIAPGCAHAPSPERREGGGRRCAAQELRALERWPGLARERALVVAAEPLGASPGDAPLPAAEQLRRRFDRSWEQIDGARAALPGLAGGLMRSARAALIEELEAVGGHLGELRLDSEYEIAAGLSAALDYMKLAALRALPGDVDPREQIEDLDARLLRSASDQTRELFGSSRVARMLEQGMPGRPAGGSDAAGALQPAAGSSERSLAALLPRRGEGLVLSASDLDSFMACPLRFKFARVLRLPRGQTSEQRFGIAVHRALERFHARFVGDRPSAQGAEGAFAIEQYLATAWRRVGLAGAGQELYALARDALLAYQRSLAGQAGEPVWLERSFAIRLGAHTLRGRVDRIDRIDDGHYEIIDYKTGRARSLEQLEAELQLEVYGLAAQQAWGCREVTLTYNFVVDGVQVRLPQRSAHERRARVERALEQVAEELLALRFTPRPSFAACSTCDFLAVCPAVES